MADSSYIPTLDKALQTARLEQAKSIDKYNNARKRVVQQLKAKGLDDKHIDDILEANEMAEQPGFGDAWQTVSNKGNYFNGVQPSTARKAIDSALREGVEPALLSEFSASLKSYRRATDNVHRAETMVFDNGGADALDKASETTHNLLGIKAELAGFARQINPNLSVEAAYKVGGHSDASLDPLKNLVAVSLDPANSTSKYDLAKKLFPQLQPLLGDKEKKLLDELSSEKGQDAAGLFAGHVAPRENKASRDIKTTGQAVFGPIARFLQRSKNLAKGRGFQTPQDVLERLASGRVAERRQEADFEGIRLPATKDNKELHDSVVSSMSKMTDSDLTIALQKQHKVIREKAKEMHGSRGLVIGRVLKNSTPFLGSENSKKYKKLRDDLRELQRGRVAIEKERRHRRAEQGIEEETVSLGGPDGPDGGNRQYFTKDKHEFATRTGDFHLNQDGNSNVLTLRPAVANQQEIQLGQVPTMQAANDFVDAFQNSRANPVDVSTVAMRLAEEATRADAGAIARIRNSGLLDERLDPVVSQADMKAFVYPLKTGDLLYAVPGKDGQITWKADSRDGFVDYARRSGNLSYQRAAQALNGQKVREQAPLMPLKAANADQAAKMVGQIPENRILPLMQVTKDALEKVSKGSSVEDTLNKVSLSFGFNALKSAAKTTAMQDRAIENEQKRQKAMSR